MVSYNDENSGTVGIFLLYAWFHRNQNWMSQMEKYGKNSSPIYERKAKIRRIKLEAIHTFLSFSNTHCLSETTAAPRR